VEALIAAGCKLDPVNSDDSTSPLHDAAAGGYLSIVQLLLDKAGPGMVSLQVRQHTADDGRHGGVELAAADGLGDCIGLYQTVLPPGVGC